MTEIALLVELMLVFATFLVGLVLIRLACHQASRYEEAQLSGEPYRLLPPLRWLVLLLDGQEAVDYADMLASGPQDVRDLRAQYLREQRTRIDRLLARVREFRERHARWPDPRELACRDRDTHDGREDS